MHDRSALDRRGFSLLGHRFVGPIIVLALGVFSFAGFFLAGAGSSASAVGTSAVGINPAGLSSAGSTTSAETAIRQGHNLFIQHCSACHGINGGGVGGRAPSVVGSGAAAADWYLETGRMPLNNPNNEAMRHAPYFNSTEIDQLVAYVASLGKGPGIPQPQPLCAGVSGAPGCTTLSNGMQLFSLNCAQCHNLAGAGGMLSKGNVIPSLIHATAVQVVEAMRVGPKPMPVFSSAQLSDHEASSIANYVQYLRHPTARAGQSIGRFGPIPEGFVGIVIGLGVLLVASRLIGTRG